MAIAATVGFFYGPASEVVLTLLNSLQRSTNGESGQFDIGVLLTAVLIGAVIGLLAGVSIGALVGLTTGGVTIAILRMAGQLLLTLHRNRLLLIALNTVLNALIGLVLLRMLNLPAALDYLGADWIQLGWVVWIAIPVLLGAATAWWVTQHILTWLDRTDSRSNATTPRVIQGSR